MADVFISWTEIDRGDLPDCCLSCGADGAELVSRRLQTFNYRLVYGLRRHITVELPFCEVHRTRSWVALGRTEARQFTEDGVWIKNASPDFIEELERFREAEERRGERDGKVEEMLRLERRRPSPQGTSMLPLLLLEGILVPVFLVGACCLGSLFISQTRRAGQAGFNAQPRFGPGGGPRR